MGKSLAARFNGQTEEVIDYAQQFGIFRAMEHYQVKDYGAMANFLDKVAPDKHLSLVGTHNPGEFSRPDAFDKLLEAMLRKYETLNSLVENKDAQIAAMKRELDYFRSRRQQEATVAVQAILSECKG